MNRRGFLQTLAAGAAMVMLPSLATEVVSETPAVALPATAADLTAWINSTFRVFAAAPAAFLHVKIDEMPLYGFSEDAVPPEKLVFNEENKPVAAKFDHFVMAYGIEGDDPVEAERRLVEAAYKELSTVEGGVPLFLRFEPKFDSGPMTEYGDTFMTWEEISDKGLPDTLPDGVEMDFNTDSLKYVKRRYTLNKLRLRLSLPTLPEEKEEALCITEGSRPKRI